MNPGLPWKEEGKEWWQDEKWTSQEKSRTVETMETPFHQWGRWDDDGGRTRWEIKMKWKCPVANDKPWSEDYKFLTRYDTQAQYKDMTQTFNPHNTIWEEKCVNQEFNSILFVKWRYRNEDRIKIFLPFPLSLFFACYLELNLWRLRTTSLPWKWEHQNYNENHNTTYTYSATLKWE